MLAGRMMLAALTCWALLMIVPDFSRVIEPLASTGLAADNDGVIYDIKGPFPREEDSPAWQAGLRPGDRLDLHAMNCRTVDQPSCIDLLAVLGGMGGSQLVSPERVLRLQVVSVSGATLAVELAARQVDLTWLDRSVLVFNVSLATLFILAAAWLVWTRPGAMTWGFFIYAIWFNPGQDFAFYAFLQDRPSLLLVQEVTGAIIQGLGYAGLVLFALRVPSGTIDPAWRRMQFVLPVVALVSAGLQLLSYANAFGWPTEAVSRAALLVGLVVDAAAILILLRRRRGQPPQEYQRLRWVIWGCLIGLPAFIAAAVLQSTTLWQVVPGLTSVSPDLIAALYGLQGVCGWFVFEAVRRPRVVGVSFPLRRITIFGLMLSVPALLLHLQIEHLHEWLHLPPWSFFVFGSVLLFLISRMHELGVELADHVFNRAFRRELAALRIVGEEVLRAESVDAVDAVLTAGPMRTLELASAAVFRRDGAMWRCHVKAPGWPDGTPAPLDAEDPILSTAQADASFMIDARDAARLGLPTGLATPRVVVPIRDRLACHALAFYGPHATGADLSLDEQAMLRQLAAAAALAYRDVEAATLRRRIAMFPAQADWASM